MAEEEIVHIAIAPPAKTDENLAYNVSTIINKRPYDTRLLLAGEIPKIIARYNGVEAAEAVINKLGDLGLVAIILRDSDLHQSPTCFKVHTLEFREKEILFRNRAGHEQKIDENNISLILEGRVHSTQDIETIKIKKKLSVVGTLLTGGIPVSRKVEEKTITQSSQIEYYIRLYKKNSTDTCIDMLQHDMDYSFLGVQRAVTAAINFSTVVQKLRETFPLAIFDNRMVKPFAVNEYANNIWEDIEINCKLIYLFHVITANSHPPA
jgi:hypothetical protein